MDLYQTKLFSKLTFKVIGEEPGNYKIHENELTIIQNENYHITEYMIDISEKSKLIQDVSYKDGEIWKQASSQYKIPVSFKNKKVTEIKITFQGEVVDPVILRINYQDANIDEFDLKQTIKNKEKLEQKFKDSTFISSGLPYFEVAFFKKVSPYVKTIIVKWYAKNASLPQSTAEKHFLSKDVITDEREYSKSPILCRPFDFSHAHNSVAGYSYTYRPALNIIYEIEQYDENMNLIFSSTSITNKR